MKGGTETILLDSASAKQHEVVKDVLGLRHSADNAGALIELSWPDIQTTATRSRLMIWWRLGRKNSELMRKLKSQAHQQAHQHNLERPHFYNWSRHTDRFIHRIAQRTAKSPAQFRKMSKDTFRHVISTTPWTEEYDKRLEICKKTSRLQLIATELTQLATEDRRAKNTAKTMARSSIFILCRR